MKKNYLYGVCVLFLFLLQLAPVVSFAENSAGTTTAEVTFTQGPTDSGGEDSDNKDDGNQDDDNNKGDDRIDEPDSNGNIGDDSNYYDTIKDGISTIKDGVNDLVDKYLPNTGEQQKLYLIIIGTCLVIIVFVVFLIKRKKIESGKVE